MMDFETSYALKRPIAIDFESKVALKYTTYK